MYSFQKLGEDDDETEFKSTSYPSFGMANPTVPLPHAYFRPRNLENLTLADGIPSLNPILDSKVLNLLPNSDTPQIFAACGRGARSSLRTLRHGLEVEELLSSDVTYSPNGLWTTKRAEDSQSNNRDFDKRSRADLLEPIQIPSIRTLSCLSSTVHSSSPSVRWLKKSRTRVSCLLSLHSQCSKLASIPFSKFTRKAFATSSPMEPSKSGWPREASR
jgi:hypothetical protein